MQNTVNNLIFGNKYNFSNPFTIVVDTRNTKVGSSGYEEFLFPQNNNTLDSYIDFIVDWGDGNYSRITSKEEAVIPHKYEIPGIYTINFYNSRNNADSEIAPRYEVYQNETDKLLKILRWGQFSNSRGCFKGCKNLDMSEVKGSVVFNANGESNFQNCTSLKEINGINEIVFNNTFSGFFDNCSNINQSCELNITNATAVSFVFRNCSKLNDHIILNAPKAVSLNSFFQNCISLNVLPVFNTPNANNVSLMFANCTSFNKDISELLEWGKVTNMSGFMTGKSSANYNPNYYDNLLIALDRGGQTNVPLGMGTIKYTSSGMAARNNLINKGWTILDGGMI